MSLSSLFIDSTKSVAKGSDYYHWLSLRPHPSLVAPAHASDRFSVGWAAYLAGHHYQPCQKAGLARSRGCAACEEIKGQVVLQFEVSRGLGEVLLSQYGRLYQRDVVSEFGPLRGPRCEIARRGYMPLERDLALAARLLARLRVLCVVTRRWRRGPPRHRHARRHRRDARGVSSRRRRHERSWRRRRDDSARSAQFDGVPRRVRTWSLSTNHLLINFLSDKAKNGNVRTSRWDRKYHRRHNLTLQIQPWHPYHYWAAQNFPPILDSGPSFLR